MKRLTGCFALVAIGLSTVSRERLRVMLRAAVLLAAVVSGAKFHYLTFGQLG